MSGQNGQRKRLLPPPRRPNPSQFHHINFFFQGRRPFSPLVYLNFTYDHFQHRNLPQTLIILLLHFLSSAEWPKRHSFHSKLRTQLKSHKLAPFYPTGLHKILNHTQKSSSLSSSSSLPCSASLQLPSSLLGGLEHGRNPPRPQVPLHLAP